MVFNESGDLLGTNEYFSVGGGFVVSLSINHLNVKLIKR